MSYNCGYCRQTAPKGQPLLRHIIYRPGTKTIAQEVPVCKGCKNRLDEGFTESELRNLLRIEGAVADGQSQRRGKPVEFDITPNLAQHRKG